MKRVGIYSGSFDPIHNGHLAFAEAAIKACSLDKIFFLVEPKPRRKQGVKAFDHRVAMVRIALRQQPQLGTIILQQQRFTVQDTLPILEHRFKGAQLYMLIGDDFFSHLAAWPGVSSLISSVEFIVGNRRFSKAEVKKHVQAIEQTKGLRFRYHLVDTLESTVSSSAIRSQLKRHNLDAPLHPGVLRYINRQGLYKSNQE